MTVVLDLTNGRPRHPEKAHRPDTPAMRGMINRVSYLLVVSESA